jgi:eukaryotic-like serine/threonine-protein kinase
MAEKLLKNRYLIEDIDRDKLGKGAFGHTYLAKDNMYHTDQRVVIKHLQPDYSGCSSNKAKRDLLAAAQIFFQREALVLKKLGSVSDQIPSLIDYFVEDDEFYIVQERIDGESLGKKFTPGKQWSQVETIDLLIEILEPLKFCHDEKTIHRDLKPENLMRRTSGKGDGKLVLIDFGAVREIRQTTLLLNGGLRAGSIIGTPGYMPFEQSKGFPELASDVYAVGVMGIQAMTGLNPLQLTAGFGMDADGIPKWREARPVGVTNEFAAVLNKMLAVLHNNRYFDAATALEALKPLAQPVVPQPVSLQTLPKFQGSLSQEIFTFEAAKLERVSVQKVEIVKKPGWLGIGEKEERQTKTVQEWRVKKFKAKAERFTENLENGVNLEMVYVSGGSFTMGSEEYNKPRHVVTMSSIYMSMFAMGSEEYDSEKPRHVVMVPSFYMGKFQVTQEQYLQIMGTNPASWQDAKLPVEKVSWNDAQVFCQKLSAKTGKKYRLPSEAEWEYACRAKTDTPFYFGEAITTELANYNGDYVYKSGVKGVYRSKTTPVGSFPANGFGLHDMHGNVWEWCEDKWHENYQGAPTDGSAWISGNDSQSVRLLRGGSWDRTPISCRSASRGRWLSSSNGIGFRVVCAQDL